MLYFYRFKYFKTDSFLKLTACSVLRLLSFLSHLNLSHTWWTILNSLVLLFATLDWWFALILDLLRLQFELPNGRHDGFLAHLRCAVASLSGTSTDWFLKLMLNWARWSIRIIVQILVLLLKLLLLDIDLSWISLRIILLKALVTDYRLKLWRYEWFTMFVHRSGMPIVPLLLLILKVVRIRKHQVVYIIRVSLWRHRRLIWEDGLIFETVIELCTELLLFRLFPLIQIFPRRVMVHVLIIFINNFE